MFDIEQVELDNFRSYRGKHTFTLPVEPRLYSITGHNEVEPRLGANGVGKSTLLDAIFWALYGKTTRGLKAADVVAWGEGSCGIQVSLTVAMQALQIRRTQSPNSLTLNGKPISQEALEKHLRLGPEAFTYAVLLPQFGESFFDLAPAAKLNLFSQIMELDYWLDKSGEAQLLAEEVTTIKKAKELALAKCSGQLETITEDIKVLEQQLHDYGNEQAVLIAKLRKELATAVPGKALSESIGFTEQALLNIRQKLAQADKSDKTCPKCGQKIANKDYPSLLRNQADFERQLRQLQHDFDGFEERRIALQKQIDAEVARPNPYAKQIKQKQASISAHRERIADLEKEIMQLDEDYIAVSFWINGFKRVRLFIVEETLRQLEVEVNNNMSSLGLTDWRIEFDVERENKSGRVTKGFTVFVYAPGHTEPVKFESWSGGETQRLRLAGDLGLANLIMERAGLSNTVEFFDEPSRHLSQEGLLDVAETLNQRALTDHKRIFLVDHTSIDFGDFAGRFLIIKGRGGSRLSTRELITV